VAWLGVCGIAGADWPGFRGEGTSGVVASPKAPEKLVIEKIWKLPTGDGFGQLAMVGKDAVLFTQKDADEVAVKINPVTGKSDWTTRIDKTIKDSNGNGPRTTPAIDGDRVYLYGTNMKIACLDLGTGKQVWQHDIVKDFGGKVLGWGNAASPVVVDDVVIVVGGGAGKGIIAFDKASGTVKWAKTDDLQTHATPTIATIHGKQQVICYMQSGLVSLDPKDGAVLWTFAHPYRTSTAASPVVGGKNGDIVYCSAGYGVGAAACKVARDGDKWTSTGLWRTEGKNLSHWSTPVHYGGYLYGLFGHNDRNGPLACLDIQTGEVKWSQRAFGSQGGLILLGNKLLVQSNGDLVLVDASPSAFKELGRTNVLKGKNWTPPVYSDGNVFLRNSSSKDMTEPEVVCVKLK
jgi:outer membrane protein assembly factor BamB